MFYFSIEMVYIKSRLHMQSFMVIGQGVPEIQGVTHGQTNLRIYYIDYLKFKSEPKSDNLSKIDV